jgi:hypothetical protein
MEQKKPIQIADMRETEGYARRERPTVAAVELGGIRTVLFVPMMADEQAIGVIAVYRSVVRPFVDKQIALVENFAKQAVIAIENTRLLNELRQRTTDLGEALEQQSATSEVLRVIARSPTDAQPAFEAMVARAARLCEADFSAVARFENGLLHLVAMNNLSPAEREAFDSLFPRPPERNFAMGRAFIDGVSVQFWEKAKAPVRVAPRPDLRRAGVVIGVSDCGQRSEVAGVITD